MSNVKYTAINENIVCCMHYHQRSELLSFKWQKLKLYFQNIKLQISNIILFAYRQTYAPLEYSLSNAWTHNNYIINITLMINIPSFTGVQLWISITFYQTKIWNSIYAFNCWNVDIWFHLTLLPLLHVQCSALMWNVSNLKS